MVWKRHAEGHSSFCGVDTSEVRYGCVGRRGREEQLTEMIMRVLLSSIVLAGILVTSAGCTHVAPYERGKLAHITSTDGVEGPAAEHVRAVHEGATGGGSVTAGGCGCN